MKQSSHWLTYLFSGLMGLMANPAILRAEFQMPEVVQIKEVPVYPNRYTQSELNGKRGHLAFQFPYASPEIMNPGEIARLQNYQVQAIDLVFTKYPENFANWRTDYGWLLEHRLRALYELDSTLFHPDAHIRWQYVLQTDCQTEPEAEQFFHGLVLFVSSKPPSEAISSLGETNLYLKPLIRQIFSGPLKDSSIYHILDQHPEWRNKLVVMDWTASMYDNGAAAMNWHRKQLNEQAIRHLVLFNDGNQTPHSLKRMGKTGGVYHLEPTDIQAVLELMDQVMNAGLGGDPAENDIEALLRGTRSLDDFGEVVLIPDRNTSIRDLRLLTKLRHPIRIVLFTNALQQEVGLGSTGEWKENPWIHPHYLTLASMTKGSVHTHDRDFYELSELKAGEKLEYGGYVYQKQENGTFQRLRN